MKTLLVIIFLLLTSSLAGAGMSNPPAEEGSLSAPQSSIAKKESFNGVVEIYVTSWCRYCRQAIDYLKSNGIQYVAYDIEKDSAARQKYEELGGQGVPFIIIGSNKMSGYSQEALEYYLENSR
jgi:glutaredoxin-like YruB-family protein